ncbi:MAG: NAD(P)/FAD-dependent oxidoreductase [Phycisphaerae bacterium]|nr:NAD(P)/FAD-dependent oxidoreductase [Phycisphaerae bacterium]
MTTKSKTPYTILGNSVAAIGAVTGIREVDPDGPIRLIAKETYHTYSRPLISYLLGGKVDETRMPYRPPDFYDTRGVEPLLGVEATRVDPDRQVIETTDGEAIEFEKLLIAVGGKPIVPPNVVGIDAEGVFTFTSWDDARRIQKYIDENAVDRVVVIGGGLIGLKSVEALVELGIKVSVVELADRILSVTFDQTASDMARASLERVGVDVYCGTTATEIKQVNDKVRGVILRDGAEVPCSMVVFAVGVFPNIGLIANTGIETDRGILVDDHLMTSVAGVYAAGDVAQAYDLLSGGRRPIPILPTAYRQGFIAGKNMAGQKRKYEGGLAMNAVDICGLKTISVGDTLGEGSEYEVLASYDERASVYKKIVLKGDRIVGAIFIGQINRAGIITGLIKNGIGVSDFKGMLLTEDFGLISLPTEYRKHVVSGASIEM